MTKYIGLFSGGKDSMAACHYMWEKGKLNDVLYAKTGIGLPENIEFVENITKEYGWNLHVVEPKLGEHYEDFIRKFGFPHQGAHSMIMGFLKYHPWRTWARKNPGFTLVSGRRKKESKRRSKKVKLDLEHDGKWMTFYLPIMNFTTEETWHYIRDHDLKISPIYKTLHMSGDCLCGAMAKIGESFLVKTFHQEMAERICKLEMQYGGCWGNNTSMDGAMKQTTLESLFCTSDCQSVTI